MHKKNCEMKIHTSLSLSISSSEKSICKGLANTEFCEEDTEKSSSGKVKIRKIPSNFFPTFVCLYDNYILKLINSVVCLKINVHSTFITHL